MQKLMKYITAAISGAFFLLMEELSYGKKKNISGYPDAIGLYDPKMEHDACGIGLIADINGVKSHDILEDALTLLKRLDHRCTWCR